MCSFGFLCYELLPFVFDHKQGEQYSSKGGSYNAVLVVFPLVSLIVEQVFRLQERGVTASILSGHSTVSDQLIVKVCSINNYSFLFSCPEGIVGVERWREALLNSLSEQCMRSSKNYVLKFLGGIPLLAAIATATPLYNY